MVKAVIAVTWWRTRQGRLWEGESELLTHMTGENSLAWKANPSGSVNCRVPVL